METQIEGEKVVPKSEVLEKKENPTFTEVKTEEKKKSHFENEAPIKPEFIVKKEKRKLEEIEEKEKEKVKSRVKKNRPDHALRDVSGKPLQTGESNIISSETQAKLDKKNYKFEKHDIVLENVTKYVEYYNEFKGNIIKKLNREKMAEYKETKFKPSEIKQVDFRNKSYLAPLTTVGNLPFRRICKDFGVDITCGEMALTSSVLRGERQELSLFKRHESEKLYGIQIAGCHATDMIKMAEFITNELTVDFVDINSGCPIDLLCKMGCGSSLMLKKTKIHQICLGMKEILTVPLTIKMRMGYATDKPIAHTLFPLLEEWGFNAVTLHGRSREQRYSNTANWDYIKKCKDTIKIPLIGNGDVLSHLDYNKYTQELGIDSVMVGRGALMKPWIFKEIKDNQFYDISSKERFDMLQDYVKYGLDHWGSDEYGRENTRKFLLEWMSFLYRYIPVGLLEVLPQKINQRPPDYFGRDELETKMASANVKDWIEITEMFPELGKVKSDFNFQPKHKSNSYSQG